MLRKKRPTEREVPAWKLALQREEEEEEGRAVPAPPGANASTAVRVPAVAEASACAACRAEEPHIWTSLCDRRQLDVAKPVAGASSSADPVPSNQKNSDGYDDDDDDDDDDDENFDPRNYDLDAVDDPPAEEEAADVVVKDGSPSGTDACRVAIANVPYEATAPSIAAFVSACGKVVRIEMHDQVHSKRTAFVQFETETMAQAALGLSGRHLDSDRSASKRRVTVLLAPIGATPEDDGLKYDLLRGSVTVRPGRPVPTPACLLGSTTPHAPAVPMAPADGLAPGEPAAKRARPTGL
jgi:hypothetical protein